MQDELLAIGQMLREAREAQGLTLAEVETRTKIATPVLAALEAGDTTRLPHPVYAKGFLRSYAVLLGLDAGELAVRFARAYPAPEELEEAPEERASHIRVTVRQPGDPPPWRAPLRYLVLGLAAVVVTVGGWYGFQWYLLPQFTALRQVVTSAPHPTNIPSEANPLPSAPTGEAPAFVPKDPEPEAPAISGESPAAEVVPQEGPPQPGPREGLNLEGVKARTMRVEALANAWIQAKTDDKITDYFLRQGEHVELRFTSSLRLKLGNAAGVRLILDGRTFPVEAARPGEVRTITVP